MIVLIHYCSNHYSSFIDLAAVAIRNRVLVKCSIKSLFSFLQKFWLLVCLDVGLSILGEGLGLVQSQHLWRRRRKKIGKKMTALRSQQRNKYSGTGLQGAVNKPHLLHEAN